MKNTARYLLAMSLLLFWSALSADGVIKNGAKMKVKPGTYIIDKSSIHIENNGQLIVEGMLTVDHFLYNNATFDGLQIRSSAENTGSIIYKNGTPKAKIERFMKSARPHYIGSPVVGETAEALDLGTPPTYLYEFIDGSGLNIINDNATELINGKGYYYRINPSANGGVTPVFEGTLTANDLLLDQNSNPALVYNSRGTNMLANPFSCAIDWDDESIETTNMEASVWVYDANTRKIKFRNNSGYGTLKDGIIPMGQGFYIKTQSEEATLTIPAQARRHEQQAFYKSSDEINEELNYVSLELVKDSIADDFWVGYQWNSSDGFDNGIDISKMFTFEEEPQIFSSHNNEDFTIDLIEEPGFDNKQVPVFVRVGTNGTHQLNLIEYQGFLEVSVQLEDLVTGEFIEVIDMNSYEFEANIGDEELRFILHFNPILPTGSNLLSEREHKVNIYSFGEQIYIRSNGDYAKQSKNIHFYDLNGKLLAEIPLSAGHLSSIKNDFKRKMIIVKANFKTDSFTEKVIFIK
jgi:hypothetical protein